MNQDTKEMLNILLRGFKMIVALLEKFKKGEPT